MKPLRLKLRHFIGIRNGLGLEEINVDVAAMLAGRTLIALTGANGKGKTTIMDSLHPYRIMPFRSSNYSTGSFSYFNETCPAAKDPAIKELIWQMAGVRYRSEILIYEKRQKCFLFNDETNEPVSIDNVLSDGNSTTYDQLIEKICGSPQLFFTSAFSSQNREQLSGYKNSEIKKLVSELIGSENIHEQHKKATDVRAVVKSSLSNAELDKDKKRELMQRHKESMESAHNYKNEQENLDAELKQMETNQREDQSQLDAAQMRASSQEENIKRKTILTERLAELEDQIRTEITASKTDLDSKKTALQKSIDEINSNLDRFNQAVKDDEARKITIQRRVDEFNTTPEPAIEEWQEKIQGLNDSISDLQEKISNDEKLSKRVEERNSELLSLETTINQLTKELESLSKTAEIIKEVPCNGMEIHNTCPLLSNAHQSISKSEEIKKEIDILNEKLEGTKLLQQDAGIAISTRPEGENAAEWSNQIHSLIKQKEHLQAQISKAENYEDMKRRHSEYVSDLSDIKERIVSAIDNAQELGRHVIDVTKELSDLREIDPIEPIKKRHQLTINALRNDIAAIEINGDDAELLNELPGKMATRQLTIQGKLGGRDQLRGKQIEAETKAEGFMQDADRLGDVNAAHEKISNKLANWEILCKALSPDGIIALAIDDAGPQLSALTNEILLECYGPRFSISIETQRETGSGTMAETFDIRVVDSLIEESKSIRSMSGGEKIWINDCLVRALSLFHKQNSGRTFHCLFSDESDGALDPERKVQYVKMKRKVLELGGYDCEIFISHSPDLWELADETFDVENLPEPIVETA